MAVVIREHFRAVRIFDAIVGRPLDGINAAIAFHLPVLVHVQGAAAVQDLRRASRAGLIVRPESPIPEHSLKQLTIRLVDAAYISVAITPPADAPSSPDKRDCQNAPITSD